MNGAASTAGNAWPFNKQQSRDIRDQFLHNDIQEVTRLIMGRPNDELSNVRILRALKVCSSFDDQIEVTHRRALTHELQGTATRADKLFLAHINDMTRANAVLDLESLATNIHEYDQEGVARKGHPFYELSDATKRLYAALMSKIEGTQWVCESQYRQHSKHAKVAMHGLMTEHARPLLARITQPENINEGKLAVIATEAFSIVDDPDWDVIFKTLSDIFEATEEMSSDNDVKEFIQTGVQDELLGLNLRDFVEDAVGENVKQGMWGLAARLRMLDINDDEKEAVLQQLNNAPLETPEVRQRLYNGLYEIQSFSPNQQQVLITFLLADFNPEVLRNKVEDITNLGNMIEEDGDIDFEQIDFEDPNGIINFLEGPLGPEVLQGMAMLNRHITPNTAAAA